MFPICQDVLTRTIQFTDQIKTAKKVTKSGN